MCTRAGGRSPGPVTPVAASSAADVGLVGVEPAQLLGELVAELAADQWQHPIRQAGAAQGGDTVVAPRS